ncbi:hypothetical protein BS17DRAFT_690373, partial [Gyrodon lividus]
LLPEDAQEHKLATITSAKQGTLNDHVREVAPMEHVVPYLDKLFHEAAVEWLISANQGRFSIFILHFKKMIDVASCATKGVIIPNQTHRKIIIDLFKKQMMHLKEHLNVGFLELVIAWN